MVLKEAKGSGEDVEETEAGKSIAAGDEKIKEQRQCSLKQLCAPTPAISNEGLVHLAEEDLCESAIDSMTTSASRDLGLTRDVEVMEARQVFLAFFISRSFYGDMKSLKEQTICLPRQGIDGSGKDAAGKESRSQMILLPRNEKRRQRDLFSAKSRAEQDMEAQEGPQPAYECPDYNFLPTPGLSHVSWTLHVASYVHGAQGSV